MNRARIFILIFFVIFFLAKPIVAEEITVDYDRNGNKLTSLNIFDFDIKLRAKNRLGVTLSGELTTDINQNIYVDVLYFSKDPLPLKFSDSNVILYLRDLNAPIPKLNKISDRYDNFFVYKITMSDLFAMSKHSAGEFIVTGGNTKKVLSFTYNPTHVKKFMAAILPDYLYVLHHKLSRVLPTSEDSPKTP